MCLTFFYLNPDPKPGSFSLILVFNRDEFLNRVTEPAAWKDGVLAGRDMAEGREGGTWLAINRKGKLGFLTNIYTGQAVQGEGRGFLVGRFLASEDSPETYMSSLASSDTDFSPFNLCLMHLDNNKNCYEGMYYSRSRNGSHIKGSGPIPIEPKIHGLGNHPISTTFKKTQRGLEAFEKIVRDLNRVGMRLELEKSLFEMMCTRGSNLPDEQMEFQGSKANFKSVHDKLSSIFVELPEKNYGTRMQTLVLVDFDRQVTFVERTRTEKTDKPDWKEERFEFKIED